MNKTKTLSLISALCLTNMAFAYDVPRELNFDLLNKPRQCSPAELYMGKTSCNVCDPDVPNIVSNTPKRGVPNVIIYGADDYKYFHNTYNEYRGTAKNTRFKPNVGISGGRGGRDDDTRYYLHQGYNLKGLSEHFSGAPINFKTSYKGYKFEFNGLNNRTMCETLRPKPNYQPTANSSEKEKAFKGAPIAAIGGAIAWQQLMKMSDPNGNKGQGQSMPTGGGGSSVTGMIGTEAFACLEFYTGTNTSIKGGDHLKNHPTKSHYCNNPMDQYYNNYVSEIKVYNYPIDGVDNSCFAPGTIMYRYMWLMANNPFHTIGMTPVESLKIATNRPGTAQNSMITTSQNCKPQQ